MFQRMNDKESEPVETPDFDPHARMPGYLFRELANHLAKLIQSGKLAPGSRLPGEREMSLQYNVSIGTVRRTTIELRERGLVVTIPAKGNYVIDKNAPAEEGEEDDDVIDDEA
jgi:GntR family transcriptional regulator